MSIVDFDGPPSWSLDAIMVLAPVLWKSLPLSVRRATNVNTLKPARLAKSYYSQRPFKFVTILVNSIPVGTRDVGLRDAGTSGRVDVINKQHLNFCAEFVV